MTLARIRLPAHSVTVINTALTGSSGTLRRQALSNRPLETQGAIRLTAADVGDPGRLAQTLNNIQAQTSTAAAGARSNPLNAGGVLFQGKAVTGGTAFLLPHNMGRPFVGYLITRVQGANQVTVREAALPSGMTSSQAVNLVPSATGTIDVLVF